jgi:hypothetical protein
MRFRNDCGSWSAWEPYNPNKSWSLSSLDGVKQVYSQIRNASLTVLTAGDTIVLSTGNWPSDFYTLEPCRVIDTRQPIGPLGGPALTAGSTRDFAITNSCSIPPTATAVSVNITVAQPTSAGNLRLFPKGTPVPQASSINYVAGQTRANNAIVPLCSGEMSVYVGQASGQVHFILDVNGYFQ